jgi:hypothetical protein
MVLSIDVGEQLFDLFFNSRDGYRGAYYRGPFVGLESNRVCLDILEATVANAPECETLHGVSAKIWLAEHGKETVKTCSGCAGEWKSHGNEPPQILNDRWEVADFYKAKWGCQAPRLTKLKVFGAFLDSHGNELIPHDKKNRADEIARFGWS